MPTTVVSRTQLYKTVAKSGAISYSSGALHYSSTTYPTTTRRKKPAKPVLFSQGTARSASTYRESTSRVENRGYYDSPNYSAESPVWSVATPPNHTQPSTVVSAACLNKLRSKIRGEGVNLAVALAEYRKTAKLFQDLSKPFGKSLTQIIADLGSSLAKRDYLNRLTKEAATRHLQWQYGVRPLVMDIEGSIEQLQAATKDLTFMARARLKERGVLNNTIIANTHWSGRKEFSYPCTGTTVWTIRDSAVAQVKLKDGPIVNALAPLGLSSPLASLYELTPWSFVVDWWLNVGDVLASIDSCLWIDSITYQGTRRYERLQQMDAQQKSSFRIFRSYDRSALTGLSAVSTLQYKPSVSLSHVLNGLALTRLGLGRFSKLYSR